MKRIVVLTGSFNPITNAHVSVLKSAVEELKADKGLFVAVSDDYLSKKMLLNRRAPSSFILSEETRKKMVDAVSEEFPNLEFGGFEAGGLNPETERTLRKITKEYKGFEIVYLVGADKLKSIPHWKNYDKIVKDFRVAVYGRSDIDVKSVIDNDSALADNRDRIDILTADDSIKDISSSKVRELFYKEKDFRLLMPSGAYRILRGFRPEDFPAVSEEMLIRANLVYGGRFGQNAARTHVFKANLSRIRSWDTFFDNSKEEFLGNIKVYERPFKVCGGNNVTELSVVNRDIVMTAEELKDFGLNVAIVDCGSSDKPCSGYQSGLRSEENDLCCHSNLSVGLYEYGNPRLKCVRETVTSVISGIYPLDNNFGGLYVPNVSFFRNGIDEGYSVRNVESLFKCPVITVGKDGEDSSEVVDNKIRTVLRIAIDNKIDSLVFGPFCFETDSFNCGPVVTVLKNVLNEPEFKGALKRIVFALNEGKGTSRKKVGVEGKYKDLYYILGVSD